VKLHPKSVFFVGPVTAPARQQKGRIGLDDAPFGLPGRYGLSGEAENEA